MDYPYENLGPERFQLFCQSLLANEFKEVQCFPVAQPDGGRDAVSYFPTTGSDRFSVYQVKYARKPGSVDPTDWMLSVLEDELPKIKKLIPRGAEKYFLLTNVAGTAHLNVGSIDKISEKLSRELEIPAVCWWRDDLNRRLDNQWSLKWIYPELLTGPDLLRLVFESGIREDWERRQAAVRAFLRSQFHSEEEVKFKQVELQNRLLDLFIDVPSSIRLSEGSRKKARVAREIYRSMAEAGAVVEQEYGIEQDSEGAWYTAREPRVGAASILLAVPQESPLENVVLEGGPGQGKSTITQYICQVHRIRLLAEYKVEKQLPDAHRRSAVRLPIRADLRDFATWMSKRDPFSASDSAVQVGNWSRNLEPFLAALVAHHAGGVEFNADDLIAVARFSSLLLVFDGLDEVADISVRAAIVEEITRACRRIRENAAGLQVIVTSRPAAFANSPGMPEKEYHCLTLLSLTPTLILQYADRWVTARRLEGGLRAEFNRVLKEKLDQPHLRDLARNPMQLAILLSLLHTRGSSLPDKRTALYDAYMDLFFSRESEKSGVVREYRDLLVEVHRYLAWLLHSEAETESARANISEERLRAVLVEYLESEGYGAELATKLFTGMVERVVALVSRVQGTFEFEVQPLREYFAACFLFYTAPLSTPGNEKSGARPDRFDAISRNFFWLNVTRFYAGCHSKGELPSLVQRLQELCSEDGYRLLSDPRVLAGTLLRDWVFTQNPKSMQEVIKLVIDDVSIRRLTSSPFKSRTREAVLVLPPKAGRDDLVARCFQLLDRHPGFEFSRDIVQLIQANVASPSQVTKEWRGYLNRASQDPSTIRERVKWLEYGQQLGILSTLDLDELAEVVQASSMSDDEVRVLYRAKRTDFLENSEATHERVVSHILGGGVVGVRGKSRQLTLDLLSDALFLGRYRRVSVEAGPVPLRAIDERFAWDEPKSDSDQAGSPKIEFESQRRCVEFWNTVDGELSRPVREWATELSPWSSVVSRGMEIWGDRRVFRILATIGAGIKSNTERCAHSSELFDERLDLCARVRYARLRCSDPKYIRCTLQSATKISDLELALLVILSWARFEALVKCADFIGATLDTLDPASWSNVYADVKRCRGGSRAEGKSSERITSHVPARDAVSVRMGCVLAFSAPDQIAEEVYVQLLSGRGGDEPRVLEFAQNHALDKARLGTAEWNPNLEIIRECYVSGQTLDALAIRRILGGRSSNGWMPLQLAIKIADSAMAYPGALVDLAQHRIREDVSSRIESVAEVARRDHWFG